MGCRLGVSENGPRGAGTDGTGRPELPAVTTVSEGGSGDSVKGSCLCSPERPGKPLWAPRVSSMALALGPLPGSPMARLCTPGPMVYSIISPQHLPASGTPSYRAGGSGLYTLPQTEETFISFPARSSIWKHIPHWVQPGLPYHFLCNTLKRPLRSSSPGAAQGLGSFVTSCPTL